MSEPFDELNISREKFNLETSKIAWRELQRFYAAGRVISVAEELNLLEAAHQFSQDNTKLVEQWLESNLIGKVTDAQALQWYETDAMVWAVVVKPWVLTQDVKSGN